MRLRSIRKYGRSMKTTLNLTLKQKKSVKQAKTPTESLLRKKRQNPQVNKNSTRRSEKWFKKEFKLRILPLTRLKEKKCQQR